MTYQPTDEELTAIGKQAYERHFAQRLDAEIQGQIGITQTWIDGHNTVEAERDKLAAEVVDWRRRWDNAVATIERLRTRLEQSQKDSRAVFDEGHRLEEVRSEQAKRLYRWASVWKLAAAKYKALARAGTREREEVLLHYEADQRRIADLEAQLAQEKAARDRCTVDAFNLAQLLAVADGKGVANG